MDSLEETLNGLENSEKSIESVDKVIDSIRITKLAEKYAQRRHFTSKIDKFWFLVFSQHHEFPEYLKPTEAVFLEYLKDLYVEWLDYTEEELEALKKEVDDPSLLALAKKNPQKFSITFTFECENGDIKSQSVAKTFKTFTDGDDQKLVSEKVDIEWPPALSNIQGLSRKKSFFTLFEWTSEEDDDDEGLSVGDLVNLLLEDVYPNCVQYYTLIQEDQLEEELIEGEESEGELGGDPKRRKVDKDN